jgi:hypothetical protein
MAHHFSFERYYFKDEDPRKLDAVRVNVNIQAQLKRRFGLRSKDWPYYLWLESFIETVRKEIDGEEFFKQISWDSIEIMMRILEQNNVITWDRPSPVGHRDEIESKIDAHESRIDVHLEERDE